MSLVPSNIFDPFDLHLWDPFQDRRFNTAPSQLGNAANARVDWKETPQEHVFKADLPGVTKDDVHVEVEDGNVLKISGHSSREKGDKTDTWHRMERGIGKFLRRFRLPENAKVDQAKAAMENGVLTVTVPKEQAKEPELKPIEIAG